MKKKRDLDQMEASLRSFKNDLEGLRDQLKKAQDIINISEFINNFKDVPS